MPDLSGSPVKRSQASDPLIPNIWCSMQPFILVILLWAAWPQGAKAAPLDDCRDHWEHGRREQSRNCYLSALQNNSDPLVQAQAAWKLGDKKRANDLFRAALTAHPKDAAPRVYWGRLFLETHNKQEATKLFQEALKLDP